MFIEVVKSKIHRVTVTEANLNYIGSITVDEDLLDAANLIANEKVAIVNNNTDEREKEYHYYGRTGQHRPADRYRLYCHDRVGTMRTIWDYRTDNPSRDKGSM